jgi:hypothetical protein
MKKANRQNGSRQAALNHTATEQAVQRRGIRCEVHVLKLKQALICQICKRRHNTKSAYLGKRKLTLNTLQQQECEESDEGLWEDWQHCLVPVRPCILKSFK